MGGKGGEENWNTEVNSKQQQLLKINQTNRQGTTWSPLVLLVSGPPETANRGHFWVPRQIAESDLNLSHSILLFKYFFAPIFMDFKLS